MPSISPSLPGRPGDERPDPAGGSDPAPGRSGGSDPDLQAYVAFMENLTAADLDRIPDRYTPDARFRDPFSDLRGHDALRRMFGAMLRDVRDCRLAVSEATRDGDTGWIRWTMRGHVRSLGAREWVVEGTSLVRFADDGRVREHLDYWDAAGQMYERLPLIGWILRRMRRRIAAHSAAG